MTEHVSRREQGSRFETGEGRILTDERFAKFAGSKAGRHKLAAELSIPYDDLYRIVLCCDMARVVGLSGKLLYYLFESGYKTLASIQTADADELNGAVLAYLSHIGKKPTLPSCSRPGNWIGAARLMESCVELDA